METIVLLAQTLCACGKVAVQYKKKQVILYILQQHSKKHIAFEQATQWSL